MSIEQYLTDEQDPKTTEKVIGKLRDMLTAGEHIVYIAVQKKPAVNLVPDSIVITDRRLVICIPGNLGLTTNFEIFLWKDIKEVSFKEEFFGAKFTVVPLKGENFTIDYIPKIQARKLYQFSNQQLEKLRELLKREQEAREAKAVQPEAPAPAAAPEPVISTPVAAPEPPEAEDEVTLKLKKLKLLFEKQLITQDEYESKKLDILSQL